MGEMEERGPEREVVGVVLGKKWVDKKERLGVLLELIRGRLKSGPGKLTGG